MRDLGYKASAEQYSLAASRMDMSRGSHQYTCVEADKVGNVLRYEELCCGSLAALGARVRPTRRSKGCFKRRSVVPNVNPRSKK